MQENMVVPLLWNPSETIVPIDFADATILQKRLKIGEFRDLRENKQEIGRNVEKRYTNKPRLVTTKDDAAAWFKHRFEAALAEFLMAPLKENGDILLSTDILNFYVVESNRYRADITLKVTLQSASSAAVLWEGTVTGRSDNWGASFKAGNYQEGLSNATLSAIQGLLSSDSFKKSFLVK